MRCLLPCKQHERRQAHHHKCQPIRRLQSEILEERMDTPDIGYKNLKTDNRDSVKSTWMKLGFTATGSFSLHDGTETVVVGVEVQSKSHINNHLKVEFAQPEWGQAAAAEQHREKGRTNPRENVRYPQRDAEKRPSAKHSSSSADKLSNNNRHDGWREWCGWGAAPSNHLYVAPLLQNSLSNSFGNPPQNKLMDHQAGVSCPQAQRSSAGEQGTSVSETEIFQRRLRLCIPRVFGIQAYIITVSSARFSPEYAEQNQKSAVIQAQARTGLQTAVNVSFHGITQAAQSGSAASNMQNVSSLWSLGCVSLAVIRPFVRSLVRSFPPTGPSVFRRMRWGGAPVWIRVCQNRKRARLKTFEGNWAGWLQQWLFGTRVCGNGALRCLWLEMQPSWFWSLVQRGHTRTNRVRLQGHAFFFKSLLLN